MRVLLAQPRGFCAGVEMALASLDRALELFGSPLYAYHQIVHNAPLVASYQKRGVIFVDDVRDVPKGAALVFSAHGVAPDVRRLAEERGSVVVDATCPLVHKVHTEARRFARAGFSVLLLGHVGHDETAGVIGEAPDRIQLIETLDDVARVVVPDPERVAYLTQTTLSIDDTRQIIAALRRRFPAIQGPARDDICYATTNRQEAVGALIGEGNLLIVIGSQNSSNSQRLAELGRKHGVRTLLIDGTDDLRRQSFSGTETVVITAGASVPEEFVQATVAWLHDRFGATVEERRFAREDLRFQLPVIVRPSYQEANG